MRFVLLLFACSFFWQCYYVKNGYYAGKHLVSRRPIREVVEDPSTPPETKAKLVLLGDILSFAEQEGLNTQGTYEYFIDIDRGPVSFLVSAAYQDQLKAYTWWFPIVGTVPYLGFFDSEDREKEALSLEQKGFDVERGSAAAFSGLGWFSDPVFSSFLKRDLALMVDLILHELVHRTLWVEGHVVFNEQLAEFIASELTVKYLRLRNLAKEEQLFATYLADQMLFHEWLLSLKADLEMLYQKRSDFERTHLLKLKASIYSEYIEQKRPSFAQFDFIGKKPWNNARLLASSLYSPKRDLFLSALQCRSYDRMGEFLAAIRSTFKDLQNEDPLLALPRTCYHPTGS
jgi:predicted aminopeptidase